VHGIHTVSCFTLIVSGLFLFVPILGKALGHDGIQALRIGHRVFAVAYIAIPLFALVKAPQGFTHMMKNIFAKWTDDDKKFMAMFVKYLFSPKTTHMPKQDEVKSGQRLADGLLVFAAVLIAISGVVLWAGAYVGPLAFRLALLAHDVSFFLIACIMVAHVYLGAGIFQPYRGSGNLMFGDGRVSESDALYHWGHWAEKELASGAKIVEE
jgi:formate dehydrogenase subunit gamma